MLDKIDANSKLFEYWGDLKVAYGYFMNAQKLMSNLEKEMFEDIILQLTAYFDRVNKLAHIAMHNEVDLFRKARELNKSQTPTQPPQKPTARKKKTGIIVVFLVVAATFAAIGYFVSKQLLSLL